MRSFLKDGDEVLLTATAAAPGCVSIGLGECHALVLPAADQGGTMPMFEPSPGATLVAAVLGERCAQVLATIDLDAGLIAGAQTGGVTRACFAAALNVVLFDDLLARVPTGAAFVADQHQRGQRIVMDHGALRTIRFAAGTTGALPGGRDAVARILEPLGYAPAGVYPLPRINMTGYVWAHRDLPEQLPQFFVSELPVDAFDAAFAQAADRVFGASGDPLGAAGIAALARLAQGECLSPEQAAAALPGIAAAFGCHHPLPTLADYQVLLEHSAEAAWIATEGNAFNHATSRVADVTAEADRQRRRGLPIKERVEISATGRVRQTAFLADPVTRRFGTAEGVVERQVPGSFYEIISRDRDPATGTLDLSFDSGNATGIFAMTRAR